MTETEQIKDRLPIEQLIGSYVPLKKAGRIFKACCPFHNEKTPSFTVSPERGIFKCFGCGEGGDIFDFVMKIDGLTFPEALNLLAERAGVELPKNRPENQPTKGTVPKERLYQVNAYAAKLWHTILTKHPKAETARAYLAGRGVSDETIRQFGIGYAPFGTTTALALKKAGFSVDEVAKAGEPTRFQDRITFPIADITGRTVGFTGRLLESPTDPSSRANRGPKYWNTPETPLFIKSRTVYGLHLAKRAIQDEDTALLVEGQMDVVMLRQAGYANAVASSGTALTPEQVRLLGRFSQNIAFAYDQDSAGIEATKRGMELVLAAELNPFVIVVPKGKDPAECLQKDPELWKEAYQSRQPFMSWLIDQSIAERPELTPSRKKELVRELLPWIARIRNEVEQTDWVRWLATRLQTEEAHIRTALKRLDRPSKPADAAPNAAPVASGETGKAELAAALLLAFPIIYPQVKDQISDLRLEPTTPFLSLILPILEQTGSAPLSEHLAGSLNEEERKTVSLRVQELLHVYDEVELDPAQAMEEFFLIARRLRSDAKEQAKARLAKEISLAQQMNDTVKLQALFSELKNLL
ncbi:DNA primase [Patescibacteria group bacterium]|nr:DNA primase [Patescibacteria group bacterium]